MKHQDKESLNNFLNNGVRMRNVESDIINAVVDAQVTGNHLIGRNNALENVFNPRASTFVIQWWLQIRELQIREFSLIWPKTTKMANKGILNIPLFDIKIIQIWLDFVFISTSLVFEFLQKVVNRVNQT